MVQEILIVDDETDIRDLISGILTDEGYATRLASDGTSALNAIKFRQPNLVILDVWLGDSERDGIKILEIIKRDHPFVPVIMISGHSTIETAVAAIKKGAYDFLEKPFDSERLLLIIQRALETAKLKRENAHLKQQSGGEVELIGQSQFIQQIRQLIERVAPTNSRILITGPSGSGKEVVARKVHQLSRRCEGPFVVLNCATLHPDRLEAELFGTEIVGLDASMPRKIGLLEQAHGGTLFLDEVTDLPLPTQSKLIRVLQDHSFSRLGDNQKIDIDVRIIGATSGNILQVIADGHFREDLFYRLNVVPINLPSLQERITDLPLLVQHFMNKAAQLHGRAPRFLSEEAIVTLQSYAWPGNIRQLRNVVEWILIMASGDAKDLVTAEHLPPDIRNDTSSQSSPTLSTVRRAFCRS